MCAHFQSDQRGGLGSVSILINGYASVPRIRNVLFYSRTRCQNFYLFQEFQRGPGVFFDTAPREGIQQGAEAASR